MNERQVHAGWFVSANGGFEGDSRQRRRVPLKGSYAASTRLKLPVNYRSIACHKSRVDHA